MAGINYVVAFGGGVASFVSPCVLPVVPAYLSTITGLDLAGPDAGGARRIARIARDTGLFFAGFAVVFVALGVSATALGKALFSNQHLLGEIAGGLVVGMAAVLAGSLVVRLPALYREVRFHPNLERFGPFAVPIAGAAFGLGWTPCLGPVLASVLAVSATERGLGRGALLLLAYAVGLGVPFLVLGMAIGRLTGVVRFLRRHGAAVTLVSAVVLAGFGVLLIMNRLSLVTTELESALRAVGLGRLVDVG
jgi:cytochrome c-type biogenesis protein